MVYFIMDIKSLEEVIDSMELKCRKISTKIKNFPDDDAGLHGCGAAASDHQHITLGLVQPLQLFRGALNNGLKVTTAVADRMAPHGLEHRFGHRGRTRDHQGELVLHGEEEANLRV